MKKIILSVLMFIPLGIFAQEMKIAVVNFNTVLMALPEVSTVETEMAKFKKQYESQLQQMQDEYTRKNNDLIEQGDSLTENIKLLRLQEIQDMRNRMENFVPVAQEEMQKKQVELVTPLHDKVNKAIKEVGTENGYAYILIDDPQIVLFKGTAAIDVTEKVKAKLGIK